MFNQKTLLIGAAAGLLAVNGLSTGCTTQVASLALGDLGSCLQLTSLLPVIQGNGDFITEINTYLSSLCSSSTPTCSNSTLSSAQSSVSSACSSDISAGGTDATEVEALQALLAHYPQVYTAGCSKNSTTNQFCLTSTLSTIQNTTGTNISVSTLTGLLSGSGDQSSLQSAFSSGQLCTGCVQEIYYQALQANSSIANTSFGQSISSTCGSSFSTSPSGVSTTSPTSAATSSAASGSSGSSTGGASEAFRLSGLVPVAIGGVTMMLALAVGGSIVL